MRVAGSGVERTAAGQSLPARRRARGSGESRGTERDRRPLSGSVEPGAEAPGGNPRTWLAVEKVQRGGEHR